MYRISSLTGSFDFPIILKRKYKTKEKGLRTFVGVLKH